MFGRLAALAVLGLCLITPAAYGAPVRPSGECLDAGMMSSAANLFAPSMRIASSSGVGGTAMVTVAQDFSVQYFSNYKVVTNKYSSNETYVLYPCGVSKPDASQFPAGTKFFEIPLTSVSVDDTSVLAFLKLLGVENRVRLTTQFAVDSCQQTLGFYSCKQLSPSSYNMNNNNTNATLAAAAQLVDAFMTFSPNANPMTISVTATVDPGVLNRAEWIKYIATFFNKEDVANYVYNGIYARYQSLNASARAAASVKTKKPVMAWLLYSPPNPAYGPIYGKASVQIGFSAYRLQYTQDSGAQMLDKSVFTPFVNGNDVQDWGSTIMLYNTSTWGATLRAALANVDFVVDETRYPNKRNQDLSLNDFVSAYGFNTDDLTGLPFLRSGQVLRLDAQSNPDGYTQWYEDAVAQPDAVLRDFIRYVTPDAVNGSLASAQSSIVRSLTTGAVNVLTTASCPLPNCQLTTNAICPLLYKACDGSIMVATAEQRCAPTCSPPPAATPVATASASPLARASPLLLAAASLLAGLLLSMLLA